MSENPNLAVQARFAAAVMAGDVATLKELSHPEMVLTQGQGTPYAGTYLGASGFLEFLGKFAAALDLESIDTTRIFQSETGALVCEFDLKSTLKASGARYDTTLMELWEFKDGKVITIRPHYFDKPGVGA
jgi:uncharacterized protein